MPLKSKATRTHISNLWTIWIPPMLPDLAGLESDNSGDAEFIEMEEIQTEDGLNQ